jgi:hypothetical protein
VQPGVGLINQSLNDGRPGFLVSLFKLLKFFETGEREAD